MKRDDIIGYCGAIRAARPYQHMRRLILLQLYTGSRPGVIMKGEH